MKYFGFALTNPFRSFTPRGFYDSKKGHTGIDILMPVGTELSLPLQLKVVQLLEQNEMGNTLYLEDFAKNVLVFSHLSAVMVKVGDTVQPNQVFALSGNTGSKTTAPHLHLEIISKTPQIGLEFMTRTLGRVSGYNINPQTYLDEVLQNKDEKRISDKEWCETHIPEGDWGQIPDNFHTIIRYAVTRATRWGEGAAARVLERVRELEERVKKLES